MPDPSELLQKRRCSLLALACRGFFQHTAMPRPVERRRAWWGKAKR